MKLFDSITNDADAEQHLRSLGYGFFGLAALMLVAGIVVANLTEGVSVLVTLADPDAALFATYGWFLPK